MPEPADLPDGWIQKETRLVFTPKSKEIVLQKMHEFMKTSKEYCDRIEESGGFSVRQVDRLTAEVWNNQQADRLGMTLEEYINDNSQNILEYGILISEQKGSGQQACKQEFTGENDWHKGWGSTTVNGGNSFVYSLYLCLPRFCHHFYYDSVFLVYLT